mmetsp:Transcript_1237/g.3470  ORF Transcript_1237/g.3470 Transcript_1237/m.3470 type:complete len:327 (-) Transcript_1237:276-1256(-)|eukprot:CAMPEP_0115850374 /NCGR_PEP_ID=MMETSP0287-20121206/11932_1 /TAXON_ID=412157 /ORGANISM="Chrysochromulina rotalis, Strain UIO044" /LENGTH=326 /DNA_ID=CAMNT_0003304371 /DNA_START=18 /DNA_END=998 /DNA_ORIENTATION=+
MRSVRFLPLLTFCRTVVAANRPAGCLRTPRAIAIDLDGTLFTSDGTISQRTCDALSDFVRTGGIAMLATGRGRSTAVRVASELADAGVHIECIICSDGSIILQHDPRAGEDVWSVLWTSMRTGRAYPLDALREALPDASFAAEIDGLEGSIIDSQAYIDTIRAGSASFAARFLAGREPTPNFDHVFRHARRVGWLRALPEAAESNSEALCSRINDVLQAHAPMSDLQAAPTSIPRLRSLGALTIMRRGTDKRNGLAAAAKTYGLDASDVLAFGDHNNDLGMFAWAGQSVCPSNANGNARAAATWCSPFSNDEDFIAETLEGVKQCP